MTEKVDVMEAIQNHAVTTGEKTLGWVHTHGMRVYGLPELEIRDVPMMLVPAASMLLNEVADYMLNEDVVVKVGERMRLGPVVVEFSKLDPIKGGEEHYEVERWTLTDPEGEGEARCECDNCPLESEDPERNQFHN